MELQPYFSIVTPVYNTPLDVLARTVESVTRQSWRDWELVLIDDASPDAEVAPFLSQLAETDSRIRVISREANGGISAASNDGVAAATGKYLALLDHDDLLVHSALRKIAAVLQSDPSIDYLYTDEDKIDMRGERFDAFAKPNWSPERLRNQMYTGHLSVMRLSLVRDVGGFRDEFNGSQDHDLVLRVTERAGKVHHLPEILYHWRVLPESTASSSSAKPYTWDAGVRAVNSHLERQQVNATAERGPEANTYRLKRRLDPGVTVSVVIPTRGGEGTVWGKRRVFVVEAVRSLLAHTTHPAFEIVVVYDTATPARVLDELRALCGDKLVLVEYDKEFNFSEKCNVGFLASSGDVLIMLNDDVEVISRNFIEELVAPLVEPGVGMTGAYLLFEDGTVQHGGHRYAERGYHHSYPGYSDGDMGPFSALVVNREASGVTAACVAIKRELFGAIGGFCENLPSNFNDVDFSLKVRASGHRILWLASVKLNHFESKTRIGVVHKWEIDKVRERWGVQREDDYVRNSPPSVSLKRRAEKAEMRGFMRAQKLSQSDDL